MYFHALREAAMTTIDLKTLDLDFSARPVVLVHQRLFVLLDDLRPALGIQWLPAADVTMLASPVGKMHREGTTVPVWYDGSGVCYVRHRSPKAQRLPVVDLPLWIGIDNGALGQQMAAA
jgi:hypothetical protein